MKLVRLLPATLALVLTACGSGDSAKPAGSTTAKNGESTAKLEGQIRIDGSSTVFPITAAVAEEFGAHQPKVRVAVSYSGTGGGFKKFDLGETDINNASRPIKQSEADTAGEHGVHYIELPVAYDGLTVILNPKNDWVDHLTVEELNKLWSPDSKVSKWSEIRAGWPDRAIKLYGAGTDSGTFDYFTEAIMGKSGASRSDYTATEDDNLTVQGVAGDVDAMGYLGIAYFEENKSLVRAAAIKNGDAAPVAPTLETVMNGTYAPLSRPLFIYVRSEAAERPEVDAFVDFYLTEGAAVVEEVGYIPLPEKAYAMTRERFDARTPGSLFLGGESTVGMTVEQLLSKETGATH